MLMRMVLFTSLTIKWTSSLLRLKMLATLTIDSSRADGPKNMKLDGRLLSRLKKLTKFSKIFRASSIRMLVTDSKGKSNNSNMPFTRMSKLLIFQKNGRTLRACSNLRSLLKVRNRSKRSLLMLLVKPRELLTPNQPEKSKEV